VFTNSSQPRIKWPISVPFPSRRPTNCGPACFTVGRNGEGRYRRQRVQLSCNLLLLPARGSVVIETEEQRIPVHEGGGCFVLPGEFRITEIPDRAGRYGATLIFFNDEAIGKSVGDDRGIEGLVALVKPIFSRVCPQKSLYEGLSAVMTGLHLHFPHDLEKILLICANQAGEGVLTFLKNGFFRTKRAMNIWLESKVLTRKSALELAKLYPGGRRMFYQDFRVYQNMTPQQWVRRRRMELAAVWARHGGSSFDSIAKALGYSDLKRFRSDYIVEHRHAPEREVRLHDAPALSDSVLGVCLRPFWNFDALTMREDAVAQVYQPVPPSNGQRRRRRRKQSAQNSSIPSEKMIPSCAYAALPGWAASEPRDEFDSTSAAQDDFDARPVQDEPAPPARTTDKRRWEPQNAPFRYYEKALSGRPNYRSNVPGEQPKIARNDPALGKFWNLETTGVGDIIPFPPASEPVPTAPSAARSRMVKAA